MKKLLFFTLCVVSLSLQGQWTRIYDDKNTQLGLHKNGNNYFWVEGSNLVSSGFGNVLDLSELGEQTIRHFQISFSNGDHGILMVQYAVFFHCETQFYQTTDAGKTWAKMDLTMPENSNPKDATPGSLRLNCISPQKLVVDNGQSTWFSTNAGVNWKKVSLQGDTAFTPVYAANNDEVILGPSGAEIYTAFKPVVFNFISFNIVSETTDTFFTDGYKILEPDTKYMGAQYVFIKMVKTSKGRLYLQFDEYIPTCGSIFGGTVLYYSDDMGANWKYRTFTLSGEVYRGPRHLVFSGNDTGYVSFGSYIYRSTDGGVRWDTFAGSMLRNGADKSINQDLYAEGNSLLASTEKAALLSHSALTPDIGLGQKRKHLLKIIAYPNPVKTGADVYLSSGRILSESAQFHLYNSMGALVTEGSINNNRCNLKGVAAGTYFLMVSDKRETVFTHYWIVE